MSTSHFDFGAVDAADDPSPFVAYLEGIRAWEAMAAGRHRRTTLLAGEGRRTLLDVGCGLGDDVRAMAAALGAGGRVVGVDRSAGLIAEARARTPRDAADVMFEVADGHAMPFDDGAFDGVRFERVLQHTDDPSGVLAEACRVARPGALVVAAEPDWGAIAVDATPEVARALVAVYERAIRQPWMGRQLRRRFVDAGLCDVTVQVEPLVVTDAAMLRAVADLDTTMAQLAGVLGADDAAHFVAEVRERSASGRLFGCAQLMVAAGTTPG